MSHTPGPWRVGDNGATVFGPKTNPRTIVTLSKVAMILNETRSNARLIAAAPELLDACKLALGAFEHNWAIDWGQLSRVIKKAEGES